MNKKLFGLILALLNASCVTPQTSTVKNNTQKKHIQWENLPEGTSDSIILTKAKPSGRLSPPSLRPEPTSEMSAPLSEDLREKFFKNVNHLPGPMVSSKRNTTIQCIQNPSGKIDIQVQTLLDNQTKIGIRFDCPGKSIEKLRIEPASGGTPRTEKMTCYDESHGETCAPLYPEKCSPIYIQPCHSDLTSSDKQLLDQVCTFIQEQDPQIKDGRCIPGVSNREVVPLIPQ